MQIVIDVPEQYLLDDNAEGLGQRLKLYAALMLFQSGRLSAGAACELAGVDRYTFYAACKEHGIPVADPSFEELEAEVEWLTSTDSVSS